jgi:dipeptidyl-peptidase-4
MKSIVRSHLIWLLLFVALFNPELRAQEKQRLQSVAQALSIGGMLSGGSGPSNVIWIDGGNRYSYSILNRETGTQEIRSYEPANGKDALIFSPVGFKTSDDRPFRYTSFEWADDSKHILFQTNFRPVFRRSGISDYYFYSVDKKTLQLVVKDAGTAQLSPDGKWIGYERGGNMFVYEFATAKETQLTTDGQTHIFNGKFGWAYEEEFGLAQAWEWSPDSRYIAYWQEDESEVPIFQMTDYADQTAEYVQIRYPKVGQTNPKVRIGVVNVSTGAQQWMNVNESGDFYIPRINWTAQSGLLSIMVLNRAQNHLKLYFADVVSGTSRVIYQEKSPTWIDVFDFFAGIMHYLYFPEGMKEFLWVSDIDGWAHIYRYDYNGKLLGQVTKGQWEVTYVHAINPKTRTIYYTSTEASPLERHLYAIGFDGKGKKQLSKQAGNHLFIVAPHGKYFIDRWSNVNTPRQVELWSSTGKLLKKYEDGQSVKEYIAKNHYSPRELFSFTTTDGQRLDGYMIKPHDFDPNKRYPVLVDIYGGPGAQGVYNQWESGGWTQWLAQQGYLVVNVNNRGSGGYGSAFEKVVYKQLGKYEALDFAETAKYLKTLPYVDGENMAIRGHSYGGYMSSYTMATHPGVFKLGIVGAPVTDWKLYDSIYTERYMGLLEDNQEGYKQSAVTTHAPKVKGRLLLAHSGMDENVHMQNTMQLVQALTDAGIDADLRIYPPGAHGVAYNQASYRLLYETYTRYLDHLLKNKP